MKVFLSNIKIGEKCVVKNNEISDCNISRRMAEIGFVEGTVVEVILHSPRKENMLVNIMGGMISINTKIANQIVVEKI